VTTTERPPPLTEPQKFLFSLVDIFGNNETNFIFIFMFITGDMTL